MTGIRFSRTKSVSLLPHQAREIIWIGLIGVLETALSEFPARSFSKFEGRPLRRSILSELNNQSYQSFADGLLQGSTDVLNDPLIILVTHIYTFRVVACHFTANSFSGKVSQQFGKVSQQSGKVSQLTGKVSQHPFAVKWQSTIPSHLICYVTIQFLRFHYIIITLWPKTQQNGSRQHPMTKLFRNDNVINYYVINCCIMSITKSLRNILKRTKMTQDST